jgi:murein DD-endopeptidase MepM/ murein hydrolase activator NlpD
VSLVAPLLGLLLIGKPGLVHSIDEGGSVFRTLDFSRANPADGARGRARVLDRSASDLLSDEAIKQPVKALRKLSLEHGRGAMLVKPLSDVSHVDLFPLGNEGLRAYRGPEFIERHVTVRRGDTFADLLQLYDVRVDDALAWHAGTRATFNLSKLKPRRSLTLFFDRGSGALAAIEYRIDALNVLVAERGADREIRSRVAAIPSSTEFRVIAGTLDSNMATDCAEAGIPQRITSELADIFAWDIDFERLNRGDKFRVVYEVAIGEDGTVVQTGRILAAAIESRGELHSAILHTAEDGSQAYFDLDGRSLDRGLLRSPLEYTKITSGFSSSRMHPILARLRPHQGVDLAAPLGTPVRAMADGVVTFAGWQGQLGRTIRIDHADGSQYESTYGHLSRIASSVQVDRKVRKGEIIGYVGRTGLATGPHLHLEIAIDGMHVNPLEVLATGREIESRPTMPLDREQRLLVSALDSVGSDGPLRLTRLSAQYAAEPLQQLQ